MEEKIKGRKAKRCRKKETRYNGRNGRERNRKEVNRRNGKVQILKSLFHAIQNIFQTELDILFSLIYYFILQKREKVQSEEYNF